MSKAHFKPGEVFENVLNNDSQSLADPFSAKQRSKTIEHSGRFFPSEKSRNLLKNQDSES